MNREQGMKKDLDIGNFLFDIGYSVKNIEKALNDQQPEIL